MELRYCTGVSGSVSNGNRMQGGLKGAHVVLSQEEAREPAVQDVPLRAAIIGGTSDLRAQRGMNFADTGAKRNVADVGDANAASGHDTDPLPGLFLQGCDGVHALH